MWNVRQHVQRRFAGTRRAPATVSDRVVRAFADLVRSQPAWPADPETALVTAAGQASGRAVTLVEDDLPSRAHACLVERPRGFEIVLNRRAPASRRLVGVAHEVGHLVLDAGAVGTSVAPSDLVELMLDTRTTGARDAEALVEFFADGVLTELRR